jgi:hypothetical protein
LFHCRAWERYNSKNFSRLGAFEHVKDVKVHTTYFLPVEASTKAWVYLFSITTIFLCTFIAVPPTTYWIQTLWLILCLSHASTKRKRPTYGGTFLGSSFVKPATEHSSYLLALHMFGNHLYMCADWWHMYCQSCTSWWSPCLEPGIYIIWKKIPCHPLILSITVHIFHYLYYNNTVLHFW